MFVIYYKYDQPNNILFVYQPGFSGFLRFQNGNVILSDLIPYSLDEKYKFNPVANDTTECKDRPNRKLLTKPTNNSYVPSFANAMMRMRSPHAQSGLKLEEAALLGCYPQQPEVALGYHRPKEAFTALGCHPREALATLGNKPPFTSASASTLGIRRKQKLAEQGIETTK